MKIVLIMNDNSYPGREYLSQLRNHSFSIDVIIIGHFHSIDMSEEERCGGLWNPVSQREVLKGYDYYRFKSLKSDDLQELLLKKNYEVGIQGGTGILKENIINKFNLGILNFHPGDLPKYRGCSAPEWQIYENKDVICTCHLVDENIDTGPIILKKKLALIYNDYFEFRSIIYKEISFFVIEVLYEIVGNNGIKKLVIQNEKEAIYRKYIGAEKINSLKKLITTNNLK
jgi:folate-dependent phosphoribosylglycinamide formyltransferase PurN